MTPYKAVYCLSHTVVFIAAYCIADLTAFALIFGPPVTITLAVVSINHLLHSRRRPHSTSKEGKTK